MRLSNAVVRSVASASLLLTLPALAGPGAVRGEHSEAMLLGAQVSIAPGAELRVALRLVHDAGWHSYWVNPGDSGLATRLRWHLPDGWEAGEIEWPVPHRFELDGIHNFGYDGEVDLPMTLQVPVDATTGETITLQAEARWLVCKDICVTEKATLELPVSIDDDAVTTKALQSPLSFDAHLPETGAINEGRITLSGNAFHFGLFDLPATFMPGMRVEIFPRSAQWLSHQRLSAVVGEQRQLEFVAARNDYFTHWPEQPVLLLQPEASDPPAYALTLNLPPPDLTGDAP